MEHLLTAPSWSPSSLSLLEQMHRGSGQLQASSYVLHAALHGGLIYPCSRDGWRSSSQQHLLQMLLLFIFYSTPPALSHKKHTNKPPARARPDKPPLEALDGPKAAWWESPACFQRQHRNPVPMRTARLSHGLPLCPSPFTPNDSSKERPRAVCAAAPDPLPLPFPAQTSRNFAAKQAHGQDAELPPRPQPR